MHIFSGPRLAAMTERFKHRYLLLLRFQYLHQLCMHQLCFTRAFVLISRSRAAVTTICKLLLHRKLIFLSLKSSTLFNVFGRRVLNF